MQSRFTTTKEPSLRIRLDLYALAAQLRQCYRFIQIEALMDLNRAGNGEMPRINYMRAVTNLRNIDARTK